MQENLSIRTRLWVAGVILLPCVLVVVESVLRQSWYLLFLLIPLLVLLYDVCFSLCKISEKDITIRTAQTMCSKTYSFSEFKDVKVEWYKPIGRVVLIKKEKGVVYVYCTNPSEVRKRLMSYIKKGSR